MFIVVFDDEQGACWPMGWDEDCGGALCGMHDGSIALFPDRASARKAIRISAAYAKLCREQGRPVNEDFGAALRYVKVMPCVMAKEAEQ